MSKDNKDVLSSGGLFSKGFGFSPKSVMKDKRLSIEAKAIYAYLASYAGTGLTAFPSISLICTDLGIGKNRYFKHRKCLIDCGYITITQTKMGNKFTNNVYKLELEPSTSFECTQFETTQNETPQIGATNSNSSNNNNLNSNKENKDSATSAASISNEQIEEIANIWNSIIGTPNIRTIKKQSSRFKALNARFKEYDYDTIVEVLCKVRDSRFLTGSNNRAWSADFDWVMKPKNFLKILEDNYINKEINNEINQNNHGQSNLSRFQRTAINISREVDAGRAIIDNTPDDWVY